MLMIPRELFNIILQKALSFLESKDANPFFPLQHHVGKVFHFETTDMPFHTYLQVVEKGLAWVEAPNKVDVHLFGTSINLLKLLFTKKQGVEAFVSYQITVEGDVGALMALHASFKNIPMDVEHILSQAMGPVAAVQLGNLKSTLSEGLKNFYQSRKEDLSDYLQYEREPQSAQEKFSTLRKKMKQKLETLV